MKGDPADGTAREITITGKCPPIRRWVVPYPVRTQTPSARWESLPVDFLFGTSSIASNANVGTVVYFWDEALQGWSGGGRTTRAGRRRISNRIVLAAERIS